MGSICVNMDEKTNKKIKTIKVELSNNESAMYANGVKFGYKICLEDLIKDVKPKVDGQVICPSTVSETVVALISPKGEISEYEILPICPTSHHPCIYAEVQVPNGYIVKRFTCSPMGELFKNVDSGADLKPSEHWEIWCKEYGIGGKYLRAAQIAALKKRKEDFLKREKHRVEVIEELLREYPQFKSRVKSINREARSNLVRLVDFICRGDAWGTFEKILEVPKENFVRPESGRLFEQWYGFRSSSMPRCWAAIELREFLTGEAAREMSKKDDMPAKVWHIGSEKLQTLDVLF